MTEFPAGLTILPFSAEPVQEQKQDQPPAPIGYRSPEQQRLERDYTTTTFPTRGEAGTPQDLMQVKLFACSGSVDSREYQEATKYRCMIDMDWVEARVALNRFVVRISSHYGYRYRFQVNEDTRTSRMVALAEFALTAWNFNFQGKKGDNAAKLRRELTNVIRQELRPRLAAELNILAKHDMVLARPITDARRRDVWEANLALLAMVPTTAGSWVRLMNATPDKVVTSLDFLRAQLAEWNAKRAFAEDVAERLVAGDVAAKEYADALYVAETLAFISGKLVGLYLGIMHSIPLYWLYPATPEHEAIGLWWPWGRPRPLIDGGPSKMPTTRKKVLDPAIITATRPQDVVRQVTELIGISRTTAQRMTASLRTEMRQKRHRTALGMLRAGKTRAEVAKAVDLSPSRISAMFKGQRFPVRSAYPGAYGRKDD